MYWAVNSLRNKVLHFFNVNALAADKISLIQLLIFAFRNVENSVEKVEKFNAGTVLEKEGD